MLGFLDRLLGEKGQSTELKLIEAFNDSRVRFHDLYPILEYKDGVYLTKTGMGIIFSLHVPPYLGDGDEDNFEAFINHSYPNGTVIGFFCYADSNIKPFLDYWKSLHGHVPNVRNPEVVRKLIDYRYEFFLKASREEFWAGAKPRIFKNYVWVLYPFEKGEDLREKFNFVRDEITKLEGILKDYGPRVVEPTELVTTLKSIFNPAFEGTAEAENRDINLQILDHDTVIRVEKESEASEDADLVVRQAEKERRWRGFHVNRFPNAVTLWEFSNILFPYDTREVSTPLPDPFIAALVVRVKDPAKRRLEIDSKARYAIHAADKNPLVKFFPSIQARAEDARFVLELTEDGKLPYEASLFSFISAESREMLNRISSDFLNKMQKKNFQLVREIDVALVNSLFECLPLGTIPGRNDLFMRYSTLFSSNIASMVPLVGQVYGSDRPITLYVDRKFGVFGFNRFHSKTNYNENTIAESGGGKSFSKGDDQVCSLAYGCVIRIIDIGYSYKGICELIGGEYIDFTEDWRPCFNPFTKVVTNPDGSIHEDELTSLVSLIGILAGYNISGEEIKGGDNSLEARVASIILKAIVSVWKKSGDRTGIAEVLRELTKMEDTTGERLPMKIAEGLYPFAEGPYAHYFNGENNINYSLDYVVLELENLSVKDMRLQTAIITSLITQILREFFILKQKEDKGELPARYKILYVDEAWALFKKTQISRFLEHAARRFRKYDASLEVISQQYEDFLKGETTRAIFNNSAHLFALYPRKSDLNKAYKEGNLPFNELQLRLVSSLHTVPGKFSEFYILSNIFEGAGRLIVDKFSYWLFTTSGKERAIREQLIKEYGPLKALEILAGKPPLIDLLLERGEITREQYYIAHMLQNDPAFRNVSPEEALIIMGAVSPYRLEELKEEILRSVELIKSKVVG